MPRHYACQKKCVWKCNSDHLWWEGQQGGEVGLGGAKPMPTPMAYPQPTKPIMVDDATCQLCVKWKGALNFPKPICIFKGTIWVFFLFS